MSKTYVTPSGVHLEKVRELGRGQFGVASCVCNRKRDTFCLKEVSVVNATADMRELVLTEARLLGSCKHPNIIAFYESWFDGLKKNRLCILMEYAPTGSLDRVIKETAAKKETFTAQKIAYYMEELSNALSYCHNQLRIMHRDLKPANIMLDRTGTLKLGDFGLAKALDKDNDLCRTYCGSPLFMSPEQLNGQLYSFSTDVWSLGCVSFELMALHSPWELPDHRRIPSYADLVFTILNIEPDYEKLLKTYSPHIVDTVRWMLQKTPHHRASADEIAKHLEMRPPPIPPLVVQVHVNLSSLPPPPPSPRSPEFRRPYGSPWSSMQTGGMDANGTGVVKGGGGGGGAELQPTPVLKTGVPFVVPVQIHDRPSVGLPIAIPIKHGAAAQIQKAFRDSRGARTPAGKDSARRLRPQPSKPKKAHEGKHSPRHAADTPTKIMLDTSPVAVAPGARCKEKKALPSDASGDTAIGVKLSPRNAAKPTPKTKPVPKTKPATAAKFSPRTYSKPILSQQPIDAKPLCSPRLMALAAPRAPVYSRRPHMLAPAPGPTVGALPKVAWM